MSETEATSTTSAPVTAAAFPVAWVTYIEPFAAAIGKTVDDVTAALTDLVGPPGDEAIDLLQSQEYTSDDDITSAVGAGVAKAKLKKAIGGLRRKAPAPVAPEATMGTMMGAASLDVLPQVLDDTSWLKALRAGGVLKVNQGTVMAAVRAALGKKVGMFDVRERLVALMERFAEENEEPVSPEFFKLRKQIVRRDYAEVFEAIDGLDGSFVTKGRIDKLFGRIDTYLWPAIISFNEQLRAWVESWQQGAANPAMMMNAMMMMVGAGAGALPPGMMQPPDTGVLRDQADATTDSINKVFAVTGAQIASALAYDATNVRETLQNPLLPALVGAANRDQMLRMLDVAVAATYPRMEVNLTRFVLAIMNVGEVPAGNEELQYFTSLYMLGSQIPWNEITGAGSGRSSRAAGIGIGSGTL